MPSRQEADETEILMQALIAGTDHLIPPDEDPLPEDDCNRYINYPSDEDIGTTNTLATEMTGEDTSTEV